MSSPIQNKEDMLPGRADTLSAKNRKAAPRRPVLTIREMTLFAMFASLMFSSTLVLAAIPNVHMLGMFIMLLTVVYRVKALIPLYLFVFIQGLYYGFAPWWLPYLYIWTMLWGVTMLLPKRMPKPVRLCVYPLISGLFGLSYGTLYAPAQALLYGYDFQKMLAWIAVGFPYDVSHGLGNVVFGLLIYPLSELLCKLERHAPYL